MRNQGGKGGKDGKGDKGSGKGNGKGNSGIPDGAKTRTDAGPICFSYNRGRQCPPNCTRSHICWFCEKKHPGGEVRQCS